MLSDGQNPGVRTVRIGRAGHGRLSEAIADQVAVEEPLEIQIGFTNGSRQTRTIAITMRTPGQDRELAAGFLYAESIVGHPRDIATVLTHGNIARVELAPGVKVDWDSIGRTGFVSSSCGLCGKTSLRGLRKADGARSDRVTVSPHWLAALPRRLRTSQPVFDSTGGLHAAALFERNGELIAATEDVGRHNAVDKLIGAQFLNGMLPLSGRVLLLSGRASFELVHKAATSGIPIIVAVGAPSSLAISAAEEAGLTLAGFVRDSGFNVYCGSHRLREEE